LVDVCLSGQLLTVTESSSVIKNALTRKDSASIRSTTGVGEKKVNSGVTTDDDDDYERAVTKKTKL